MDAEENREHANVVYKYTMGNQVYIGKTNNPVRRTFERTLFPQTDADEVINANVRANTYTYEEYKASGADFTLLNFIRQKALTGGDWNENSFNYTLPQLATALAVYRMNSKTIRANTISQAQVMNAMEFLLTYREAYRGYGTSTDDENITLLVRRWGQNRVSSIDDFDINNVKTRQQVEDYMKDQINKMLQGKTEKQENKISIWAENLFRIASVEDLQHLITTVVEAGVVDAATTRLNAKRKVDIVGADNILSAQESAKNLLLSAINIWARKSQEE